jgi:protein-disulfide isomerase
MFGIGRRQLILTGAALLAGCGAANGGASAPSPDDMAIGAENAPATLIEFASTTCPHCREFHETAWDELKANYIDTGKLRFIFREFPTPPVQVAVAGFQVARCGGATSEQYMTRMGVLFEQQQAMFATGTTDGVRQKLIEIGRLSNLSEQQVLACIADEAGPARIRRVVEAAQQEFDVAGTPTLVLNGTKLTDPAALTYAGLSRLIDAAIAGRPLAQPAEEKGS